MQCTFISSLSELCVPCYCQWSFLANLDLRNFKNLRSQTVSVPERIGTPQKALSINLDPQTFGSFAEIGAGQEVARWFLQVGAASGTVAKTISAYDKEVSDYLYGAGTRYVSKPRLQSMLEHEWSNLLSQLHASRGATTRFFSFVDTVSARNFSGDNECHGWMGLRFQTQPQSAPNDVILHINLRDRSNLAQQSAVGILGVNLIHAAFHYLSSADEFLMQLNAGLSPHSIEFDYVEHKGPAFEQWNPRTVHASLIAKHLADAVFFPVEDDLIPPTELLYKKAVVLAPGTFGAAGPLHRQMVEATLASLPKQNLEQSRGSIGLFALSCSANESGQPTLTAAQILERIEALQNLKFGVLVFRERALYKMGAFVSRFTKARVHFAVELSVLVRVLQDSYKDLDSSLLEGIARLFRENVRVSVFPMPAAAMENSDLAAGWKWKEANGLISARDIEPPEPLNHLYRYLIGSGLILPRELADK
jgi:hypothetical protein